MSAGFGALVACPSGRRARVRLPEPLGSTDRAVVARRVNAPWRHVRTRLADLAPGTFDVGAPGRAQFGRPFADVTTWPAPLRCTRARLFGRGLRLARYARVEIDVTQWSNGACELRVRPISRRVTTWGGRRQRRYYALAHATADRLLRELTRGAIPAATTTGSPAPRLAAVASVHR